MIYLSLAIHTLSSFILFLIKSKLVRNRRSFSLTGFASITVKTRGGGGGAGLNPPPLVPTALQGECIGEKRGFSLEWSPLRQDFCIFFLLIIFLVAGITISTCCTKTLATSSAGSESAATTCKKSF